MLQKKHISAAALAGAFSACALVPGAGAAARTPQSSAVSTLVQAVNRTRIAHGLRPLRVDAALVRAARAHSTEMLRGNYFAHGDFRGRIVAFHVRGRLAGENLAWGNGRFARAASIIREWLASPGHRANLLHAGWTRIGIGITSGTFVGSAGAAIVTADFAGS